MPEQRPKATLIDQKGILMPLPIRLMGVLVLCTLLGLFSLRSQPAAKRPQQNGEVRAKYLITTTDDFIVSVYHNGKHVADSKRVLENEIFGATVERINIDIHKGDWIVFNVVNNRLRWGGSAFFGVAGCFTNNKFGFVSNLEDGNWSACDSPANVDAFISDSTYLRHRPVHRPVVVWDQGIARMKDHAGDRWNGDAIWGNAHNTWIKVNVE